jgi:hypothetical protein
MAQANTLEKAFFFFGRREYDHAMELFEESRCEPKRVSGIYDSLFRRHLIPSMQIFSLYNDIILADERNAYMATWPMYMPVLSGQCRSCKHLA